MRSGYEILAKVLLGRSSGEHDDHWESTEVLV